LKKSRKKRNKRRIGYNQLGMVAIALIVFVLLVGLVIQSNTLKGRLAVYDAKAASLEEQIQAEKDRTEEIDQLKKHMQTDEYAEEIAREKLGLVKENEIVFEEEK